MRGTCATQHCHLPVLLEAAQSAPCQLRMLQDRVGWCGLNLIVVDLRSNLIACVKGVDFALSPAPENCQTCQAVSG